MKNELVFTRLQSARLKNLLTDCLIDVFINNGINKYLATTGDEMEPEIINNPGGIGNEYIRIKTAFYVWKRMKVADRRFVLIKFHQLYNGQLIDGCLKNKTHLFCRVFVQEFPEIILKAIQWPD